MDRLWRQAGSEGEGALQRVGYRQDRGESSPFPASDSYTSVEGLMLFQLIKNLQESQLSSETRKAKIASINEIFSSREITIRVPPGLHQLPPLLTDGQFSNLNETMVVDCLVRINAHLTAHTVEGSEIDELQPRLPAGKADPKRHSFQRFTSFRAKGEAAPSAIPQNSNGSSPKARRILGIDTASTTSKGVAQNEPTHPSRDQRRQTQVSLAPLFQKRSFSHRSLLDVPREQHNSSDMHRSNSLSGARSLLGALLGTEHREVTPSTRSGRAEKYLRGVMDIFRRKSSRKLARSESEHLLDGRVHTRSVKLSRAPPLSRASVDNALLRTRRTHGVPEVPMGRKTTETVRNGVASPTGSKAPGLVASFPIGEKPRNVTEAAGAIRPASVKAEQIMEVLLEFINHTLFPPSDHAKAAIGFEDIRGKRLLALIQSLNRILFDTRFKVRNCLRVSDSFELNLVASS
jgi:hypothetical protein